MPQPNPYDEVLDSLLRAMNDVKENLATTFKNVRPFQSVQLTPDESLFLYDNPAQHPIVRGEVDQQYGTPITNAQGARLMLERLGPQQYVQWVETNEAYRERRADDAANGDA